MDFDIKAREGDADRGSTLYSATHRLLEDEELADGQHFRSHKKPSSSSNSTALKASCGLNLILILVIAFFSLRYHGITIFGGISQVMMPSSSGIKFNKTSTYHHHNSFWSDDDATADKLWEDLSTDPLVVAIPNSEAARQGLPPSAAWPWDPNRGRYFIRAFHEIHCLKYIRRYVTDVQRSENRTSELLDVHVLHCIDSLRQSVMCRADDTLMPTSDQTSFAIGDHEEVKCRNWNALSEWALSPERNACHRSLSDYQAIRHPLERYAFCPEGSPYKKVADRYFEVHGHRDPWEE